MAIEAVLSNVIPLSPMDAIMVSYGFAVLYVFPTPAGGGSFDLEKLKSSFHALVDEDYPVMIGEIQVDAMTGRVSVLQTIEAQERGAKALRFEQRPKSPSSTIEVLTSLEWSFMPRKLDRKETIAIRCTPLADGGAAVGVTVNHTLLDGEGLFTFMKVWGQHYSDVAKADRLLINHERHLLFGTGKKAKMPHPNARIVTPSLDKKIIPLSQLPATTQHAFHLSEDSLKALKKQAAGLAALEGDPPFVSTIDIVTALFTVLVSRARGHNQDVRITTNVNARRRLVPPLPDNYAGNCVFSTLSTFTKSELEAQEDEEAVPLEMLVKFARRIRKSILNHTSDVMRDAIDFIAQQSDLSGVVTCLKYILGPDIMFTSWARLGLYEAEFHGTRPHYTGIAKVPFLDGMVVITDAPQGAGGLDVLVFLECSAMHRLKRLCAAVPCIEV